MINWGDGTSTQFDSSTIITNADGSTTQSLVEPTASSPGSITYGHIYTDDLSHTVTLTITDQGGLSTSVTHVYGAQSIPTVVLSTPSPSTYGQSISFTATVTGTTPGTVPGGSVQFLIDGVDFGPAVTLANGTATSSSIATLGAGTDVITAEYLGDPSDAPVTTIGSQVINKAHLYVTAQNVDIAHGDAIPSLTDTITGFIPGDSLSNVT